MLTIVMICKVQKPAQGVEIPINHKNCNKRTVFMSHKFLTISVTIQVSFLLHRLRRWGEGKARAPEAPPASLPRTPPKGLQGPLAPPSPLVSISNISIPTDILIYQVYYIIRPWS